MGYSGNPNGSDLSIVTVVLQYGVFATEATGISRVGVARISNGGRVKSYTPNNIRTQYGRNRVLFMHQDSRP